jgi:hypothetical protein
MQATPRASGKARSWKEAQLIISSVSVALSLGLWSLWSSREPTGTKKQEAPPTPTEVATATPEPMLAPGQILILSTTTVQASSPVADQQQPRRRKGGDGAGGGGGGGGANASTGSS